MASPPLAAARPGRNGTAAAQRPAVVAVPPGLAGLVAGWLPAQRWFAGKGRPFRVDRVDPVGVLTTTPYRSRVWLVRVRYADGAAETYQLPLVERPAPAAAPALALGTVRLGDLLDPDTGARTWWYDALHDEEVAGAWLDRIATDRSDPTLTFSGCPEPTRIPRGGRSRVVTAEQSNSSLVFGDDAILKVFRRIEAGRNPDIEVHEALSRVDGDTRHVARLLGHVSGCWAGVDAGGAAAEVSLAMLQQFFPTATDGWELAKASVRACYAGGESGSGGDFAGEAYRLGTTTAGIHAALAWVLPVGRLDRDGVSALAGTIRDRLRSAVDTVPALAEYLPGLRATCDALAGPDREVPIQRIHGDFHLGQVLQTDDRWVVVDFEGEPARPLAERRALGSPLRDVAGMLRSFDYAARHLLAGHPVEPDLAARAEDWAERSRDAFCAGYAAGGGRDPRQDSVLLRAYEVDKAVYEAVYEARNRPAWLPIPLGALARLAEAAPR